MGVGIYILFINFISVEVDFGFLLTEVKGFEVDF